MRAERGLLSLLTVLLLFGAVAGVVAWRLSVDAGDRPTDRPPARRELPSTEGVDLASADLFMASRPVEGVRVIRDTLWIQVVGSGVAVPSRQSRIAARASGLVERVFVQEGDPVRQGDLLVQLDTAQATMNLARGYAALTRAQAQYAQRLVLDDPSGGLLSAEERERRDRVMRAESGLTEAELTLAERETELEFTRVRAPFSGRVADLRAVEGAHLDHGAEVLTLAQIDPIRVLVDVLEGEIGLISEGRQATIHFNALGGEARTGVIESINPRVDPGTRAGRITLTLPNPDARILPGNYARVSLETEPLPDRILIPRGAITMRGEPQREVVFILENTDASRTGLAGWRYVAVGRRNDTYVEIIPSEDTAMLEPGEIVLVNGHHYLAHHTPVHMVENVYLEGGTPGR